MISLVDASNLVMPILKSDLLGKNPELDEKFKVVEGHLEGYENKEPFLLNQFEILDEEIEKSIRELVECFLNCQSQEERVGSKRKAITWCPSCGAVYFSDNPELYNDCESCRNPLIR